MEMVGSFLDEEWESLSQMFCISENPNFLLQSETSSLFSSNVEIPSPKFPPSDHASKTSLCCISQESSNTTEIDETLFLNIQENEHQQQPLDHIAFTPVFPYDVMEEFLSLKTENRSVDSCHEMQPKRKYEETPLSQIQNPEPEGYSPQNPKKKPRFSRDTRKTRAKQTKKTKKKMEEKNDEEESNGGGNSSYSSEDDSNASKTRAGRGSATDPQSLYARKRRERINERLRILQNLVPNGTKVDISTMLEEAVQYVKFLQLQIKLLSSDNLWMYAPLAYNGMDISIYQKISPNLML